MPGIVHGVVVDTSFFRGNYPPQVSVEAVRRPGVPGAGRAGRVAHAGRPGRRAGRHGEPLPGGRRRGGRTSGCRSTRTAGWPGCGCTATPLPDPRFLAGTVDLAALENGGRVVGCSDAFYSSAGNLILPGRATGMAEGWENARRRGAGHDYVTSRWPRPGVLRHVEIDTSCFVGNAPGRVRLLAADAPDRPTPRCRPIRRGGRCCRSPRSSPTPGIDTGRR